MLLLVLPYLQGHGEVQAGQEWRQWRLWCGMEEADERSGGTHWLLHPSCWPRTRSCPGQPPPHQCRVLAEGAICRGFRPSCLLRPSTTPRPPAGKAMRVEAVGAEGSPAAAQKPLDQSCLQTINTTAATEVMLCCEAGRMMAGRTAYAAA